MDKFDDVSKTIGSSDLFKSMENSNRVTLIALCVDVFKLGEKSKQAEIDEYKEVAESMEDAYLREKAKIDELRKRIYEAIERSNHAHIGYQMLYKQFNDVINILKGATNEQ